MAKWIRLSSFMSLGWYTPQGGKKHLKIATAPALCRIHSTPEEKENENSNPKKAAAVYMSTALAPVLQDPKGESVCGAKEELEAQAEGASEDFTLDGQYINPHAEMASSCGISLA